MTSPDDQPSPEDLAQQAEDAVATAGQLDSWKHQLAAELGLDVSEIAHMTIAHVPVGGKDVTLTTVAEKAPQSG